MNGGLTANYSRLCRVQPPGATPVSLVVRRCQRLSESSLPARAARRTWETVLGPSGVLSQALVSRDGLKTRHSQISASPRREPADRSGAPFGGFRAVSNRQGGMCCRQRVQTGRRLMRQTVLPIMIPGRFASMRSQGFSRRSDRTGLRSARRAELRFGLPLTPESGGPSRLPAAQPAPRARRACRHQEFKNAKQNVDRCHPPGRDPGRRGPWQSRRRV